MTWEGTLDCIGVKVSPFMDDGPLFGAYGAKRRYHLNSAIPSSVISAEQQEGHERHKESDHAGPRMCELRCHRGVATNLAETAAQQTRGILT